MNEVKVALEQSNLQANEALELAINEHKEKASKELRDVKASLEKTQKEVKSEKEEIEGAISKQKMQAAKELRDVKVVVEKSQEQAKVSLLEGFVITWILFF